MKRLLLLSLIFLPNLLSARQNLVQTIDSLGKATLFYTSTAGAYLSITQDGNTFYSSPFGYNSEKEGTIISDTSVFPISSNTKAFNSILLAQMVDQNKLSWDAPIKSYMTDLQFNNSFITNEVNLTDLLTHRYGFPRYDFTYFMLSDEEKANANQAVFNKLRYMKTTAGFRTDFQYGNNQYILAAYLLEHRTKQKWETLLKERLLKPLDMKNTHCNLAQFENTEGKVIGHQNERPVDIQHTAPLYNVSGMGNMFSTIQDLEKWCNFLLEGNDDILSKKAIDETLTAQFTVGYEEPYKGFSALQYGYGWFVFDYYGHKVVMHHGDGVGHQSMIVLLPDDNISWRIISNEGFDTPSFPFVMTFSLLDLMTGQPTRTDWNKALPQPAEEPFLYHPDSSKEKNTEATVPYLDLVGTYQHEGFGTIRVFIDAGKIKFEAGDFKGTMKYWHHDSYRTYSKVFQEDALFNFFKNGEEMYLTTDLLEHSVAPIKFVKVAGE